MVLNAHNAAHTGASLRASHLSNWLGCVDCEPHLSAIDRSYFQRNPYYSAPYYHCCRGRLCFQRNRCCHGWCYRNYLAMSHCRRNRGYRVSYCHYYRDKLCFQTSLLNRGLCFPNYLAKFHYQKSRDFLGRYYPSHRDKWCSRRNRWNTEFEQKLRQIRGLDRVINLIT